MILEALNSLTKYPSILTYHPMGDKGRLQDGPARFESADVFATEKIDGTNARIVLLDGDYFIGSREEFLTARGDRVSNPSQGIVAAIQAVADALVTAGAAGRVVFGEVFGGKVGSNAKEYSAAGKTGFRVFDVMDLADESAAAELATGDSRRIASWRDAGGQTFLSVADMQTFCAGVGLPTVPSVWQGSSAEIPTDLKATREWLESKIRTSHARLDETAAGRPEGLVVRSADRREIRKLRFEDYRRTVR